MSTDTLTTLFRHHLWANLQLLAVCTRLTDTQLDATVPGTFGTIRSTLAHMTLAERSYFSRISTGQRYDHPADAPPLTLADMHASLHTTGQGLIDWVPNIQPDAIVQVQWEDGVTVAVPLTIIVTQVINHATEHRAQILVILTQLGLEPPSLDSWSYFEAQRKIE
jgi:uncharacterized damage-inducible protein DinB